MSVNQHTVLLLFPLCDRSTDRIKTETKYAKDDTAVVKNQTALQRCAGDTYIIPQVEAAMFSRSFGGEIPAAILFLSAALSVSPCVRSLSIVGAEERTLLRSSPILRPQAPLTLNAH